MWYDLQLALPSLAKYDIREVTNAEDLRSWSIPLNEGFESSEEHPSKFFQATAKIPYGPGKPFHHYVLYHEGKPVSCSTLSVSEYGARIDNVATCNDYLRQGFGRAVTLFAMQEAQRLGANIVCLESSDEGLQLYLNVGFKEIYRNKMYEYNIK
jgi:GNAT superfamily N-acetyltransferase